MQRRQFLLGGVISGFGLFHSLGVEGDSDRIPHTTDHPIVISTWKFGLQANKAAAARLQAGGSALDAVEQAAIVAEADPEVSSVGFGGRPNRDGVMELDAAIMDGRNLEAGCVAGLRRHRHAVQIARRVMTDTPHVMLVGEGASQFADGLGLKVEDPLSEGAKKAWLEWRERSALEKEKQEGHDTIGVIAIDSRGDIAASCTTSGMAWKLPGRVGDSPIIGHGLYCDQSVGGAVATGHGEEISRVCGSFHIVELMRQGVSPDEAIRRVLAKILARDDANRNRQVAFVALRRDGLTGAGALEPGFDAAIYRDGHHQLEKVDPLDP